MSSGKLLVGVWLSGLMVGVVIMQRWLRTGKRLIPVPAGAGDTMEVPSADLVTSADKPKATAAIVAGAKADAQKVKGLVAKATSRGGTADSEMSTAATNGVSA